MNSTYADLIDTLHGTQAAFDQARTRAASRFLDLATVERLYELTSLHARMARTIQQAMADDRTPETLRAEIEDLAQSFEARDAEFALRLEVLRQGTHPSPLGIAAEWAVASSGCQTAP
ncbi:hypothetical protein FHG66_16080 [Rubellimicrobium rubrum]|uniref:Uncharacterized protein n=1 Tax=Rubellimicrobium rubrum TaxID=2585369 RepID=A0A5C4MS38_9RHOB|nr:hypothetical protein [Rubellimicrobium rubrum]TNC47732.1 hypothetical protein FHG66_16080 [Rubellimicrobium rubrum]